MGLRVRIVLMVLSLLATAMLAIPLAITLADRRTAALATERDGQLYALADAASMAGLPLQQHVDRYFDVYREGLVIVDADGQPLAAHGLDVGDPGVAVAVNHALVNAPAAGWPRILPWHRNPLLTATGIRQDGELVGAVVISVDTTAAARDVATAWSWVMVGCLGFLVLTAVVGRRLTRWVLRPITGLERAVAEMTEGVAGPPADVAGPPELRHFTAAFNTMAQVVRASLDRQRRLVADASHQLRNPLTAVRLRADTLEDYVAEEGRPTYDSMSAELDRFENLLQQLLRLARAEQVSGSRKVGLTGTGSDVTDLRDVIEERAAFWQPVADRRHQRLQYRTGPSAPMAGLARHEVEQLLDVAIDNALRYAGHDATVTVTTLDADDEIELVVSDDGPGLPDEDRARAAARFWRGHDDSAGTGLGLSIAAEITAGHGGAIAITKADEGGLAVRYRLPAAGEQP